MTRVTPLVVIRRYRVNLTPIRNRLLANFNMRLRQINKVQLLPTTRLRTTPYRRGHLAANRVISQLSVIEITHVNNGVNGTSRRIIGNRLLTNRLIRDILVNFFKTIMRFRLMTTTPTIMTRTNPMTLKINSTSNFNHENAKGIVKNYNTMINGIRREHFINMNRTSTNVANYLFSLLTKNRLNIFMNCVTTTTIAINGIKISQHIRMTLTTSIRTKMVMCVSRLNTRGTLTVIMVRNLVKRRRLRRLITTETRQPSLQSNIHVPRRNARTNSTTLCLTLGRRIYQTSTTLKTYILLFKINSIISRRARRPTNTLTNFTNREIDIMNERGTRHETYNFTKHYQKNNYLAN